MMAMACSSSSSSSIPSSSSSLSISSSLLLPHSRTIVITNDNKNKNINNNKQGLKPLLLANAFVHHLPRVPALSAAGAKCGSRSPCGFQWDQGLLAREHYQTPCFLPRAALNASALADGQKPETASEPSVSVILLAGGKGTRMGANMPKQYLPLLGQPIALHSFHTFAKMEEMMEIVVVCDPSYRDIFEDAAKTISIPLKFALPGKERQDSVYNGLQEVSKLAKLACVHDSARPLVLPKDISQVIKDATAHGAAVLGVPVKATIKEAGDDLFVARTLDRRLLWEIQTPQVIEPGLLARGFELVKQEGFEVTDDVSIVEYLKHPVFITHGSYANLKVTTPDDLLVAERILLQAAATQVEKAVASTPI